MWRSSTLGFKNMGDFNVTWALGMKTTYGYKHIPPGIFELNIMTFYSVSIIKCMHTIYLTISVT